MKAIFEFNLPEDQNEFDTMTNASNMWVVIWDMKQEFRRLLKHDPENLPVDVYNKVESLSTFFNELIIDKKIPDIL